MVKADGATVTIRKSDGTTETMALASRLAEESYTFNGKLEITGNSKVTIEGDLGKDADAKVEKGATLNITGKCNAIVTVTGVPENADWGDHKLDVAKTVPMGVLQIDATGVHDNVGFFKTEWKPLVISFMGVDDSERDSDNLLPVTITIYNVSGTAVAQTGVTRSKTASWLVFNTNPNNTAQYKGTTYAWYDTTSTFNGGSMAAGTYTYKITVGKTTFTGNETQATSISSSTKVLGEGSFTIAS